MVKNIFNKIVILGILIFLFGLYLLLSENFNIENFDQTIGSKQFNVLKWSKSIGTSKYKVIIKNNNKIIKEIITPNHELILDDLNLTSNSFTVDVIAYHKLKRQVKRSKTFNWNLPLIQLNKEEIPVLSKSDITDVTINLINNANQDNYIIVSKEGKDLKHLNIEENKISASFFKDLDDYLGTYEIMLCQDYNDKKIILHKTYLNIIPKPITDIVINQPLNNSEVSLDDLIINFSGGKYADKYYYSLQDQDGKIIIDKALIDSQQFIISKDYLNPEEKYTLIITGQHFLDNNVTKSVKLNFKVAPLNKVSQIISTKPSGEIGKNRAVRLLTYTNDAQIYYTLDGSIPTKNSIEYKGSIFIDRDVTLKAIAVKEGMIDSDILELQFKAVEKEPVIYLSPSIQNENYGVKKAGYTTEREMMNKISDYIEERLKQKKIIVYRNHPDMTLSEIVNESSKYDVDLHLAIHSNKFNGKVSGVETWIHEYEVGKAYEIASLIQKALMQIYYNPKGNRGIKYNNEIDEMRETSPKNVTNGVLVEIAFHDHYKDAKWIVDNQKKIGYAIADAVASYFGR